MTRATDSTNSILDWVRNKVDSQFAFQGVCWEKSFIPLGVWQAGKNHTNLMEGSHSDVNLEGKHCSLLGAIEKSHAYDNMKLSTLKVNHYWYILTLRSSTNQF